MSKTDKTYMHRYLARIIIEAASPLSIGSGEYEIGTDALVAVDVNGLPYIPGSSIAGILRHALGYRPDTECIFGFVNGNDGAGSKILFTEARMVGSDGKVVDGLKTDLYDDDFYQRFRNLHIRQHTRICHTGTTVTGGKFDEQVVYKGTRFCFEMEMLSDQNTYVQDFEEMDKLLSLLGSETIRFGKGTRSGFGEIRIISCHTKKLDFANEGDLDFYIRKSSSLHNEWGEDMHINSLPAIELVKYELSLYPDDFFLFGSGFGDAEANITPVKESMIVWQDGKPKFEDDCILIPATSIKGALSHRTAFHYNQITGYFADKEPYQDYVMHVGKNNDAVKALFGSEGEDNQSNNKITRGHILFSDIIARRGADEKIINHIAIDRFTGGVISGALFNEKVTYLKESRNPFITTITVDRNAFVNQNIQEAFENALKDICRGLLPLGGGVNRGHGSFTGTLKKNSEIIYSKEGIK